MVQKSRRMIDIRVVCDVPHYVTQWCRTDKEREKALSAWAKELHEFLRDHRSQDPVGISVEPQYEDQCGDCGKPWETMTEEGKTYCAWCGEEVELVQAAEGK